jgi:hypothetical protein
VTIDLAEPVLDPHIQAEELARLLTARGLITTVHKTGGHLLCPCIQVRAGRHQLTESTEYVYLVPDDNTGQYWFWSSSMDPIAPATEVSVTADWVARLLAGLPARPALRSV